MGGGRRGRSRAVVTSALMLAYTPLHHLLLGLPGDVPGPEVLVMTSGNLAGEPIVTDDAEALERLAPLADAWLAHDRRIHVPCDDSVVRAVGGADLPVRRSRGYAPMPLSLPFEVAPTLAVGADVKNAFCLAAGRLAWLSGHIGDMDDLATLSAFGTAEEHLRLITGVSPDGIVVDRHPAYRSRRWALDHAEGRPLPRSSTTTPMWPRPWPRTASGLADRVLGIAFDGTGYGDDGPARLWEFLAASYASYTRLAHLSYVDLPGGDAGVRNPCRMALSHLRAADLPWDDRTTRRTRLPGTTSCTCWTSSSTRRTACGPTSSMGRLFDAVASLAGVCHRAEYDAQAAMELEAHVRSSDVPGIQVRRHGRRRRQVGRARRAGDRRGRGRRPRGGGSTAGGSPLPPGRRRPRRRAGRAPGGRYPSDRGSPSAGVSSSTRCSRRPCSNGAGRARLRGAPAPTGAAQ